MKVMTHVDLKTTTSAANRKCQILLYGSHELHLHDLWSANPDPKTASIPQGSAVHSPAAATSTSALPDRALTF